MARNNMRNAKRAPKDLNRRIKKKPCQFCREQTVWIDYKDLNTLRKFMSDRGKIRARRTTGNCEQHQHDIAEAIKTARELVLLPYTQRTTTERPGGRRGDRSDRGERRDSDDDGPTLADVTGEEEMVSDVEVLEEAAEVIAEAEELVEEAAVVEEAEEIVEAADEGEAG
jgi:small subunit ribosomal protein S18